MSAAEPAEVLKPILLRSSTPGATEKVMSYLENMHRASQAMATPSELHRALEEDNGVYSPTPRSSRSPQQLEQLAGSQAGYANREDDMDSNVQEGQLSDIATPLPQIHHEPGPDDLPGPRFESYGSSFGNFGPLPRDSQNQDIPWTTYTAAAVPLPDGSVRSPTAASHQPWTGLTNAQNVPLPTSTAAPTAFTLNVEEPTASSISKAGKATTHRSKSVMSDDQTTIPRGDTAASASRVSKAPKEDLRPLSPMKTGISAKSRGTAHSRGGTEKGTAYPPLPESTMGGSRVDSPSSPTRSKPSKALSRAYSLSPSDSPSQAGYKQQRASKSPSTKVKSVPEEEAASGSRSQAARSQPPGSVMSGANNHQSRPFSPYRHAATQEDLLHAAIMGSAAQASNKAPSSRHSHSHSHSHQSPRSGKQSRANDPNATPTPSRPQSPYSADLNHEEEEMVREALTPFTRPTSFAGSALDVDAAQSHFHDMDLCILLHQVEDPMVHDVVKKALRKAIRARVKKLGLKHDSESIKQYRNSFHNHHPDVHLQPNYTPTLTSDEPPAWAKELMEGMVRMQQRLDGLGPKIERLKSTRSTRSYQDGESRFQGTFQSSEVDLYPQTPMTETVNIQTHPTGTEYQQPETEIVIDADNVGSIHHADESTHGGAIQEEDAYEDEEHDGGRDFAGTQDGKTQTRTHGSLSEFDGRDDSPGQQYLEEELYKLRVKPGGSQSGVSHRTWEVARDDDHDDEGYEDDGDGHNAITESGLPEIPDGGNYTDRRPSPPLPPLPHETRQDLITPTQGGQVWNGNSYGAESSPPPWQRIHQRLLGWAIVWPITQLDEALNSTTRGMQVDEIALSIWSTQTYKRYVRSKMTDSPQGRVDRLFVPPNMADAINTAVFHGRHGDASGILRDLWSPFGLDGMPRLLIVLAKHRSDENHWVVHRFSLPDGALTTYDSFPERTLPDGRPLGWWFAIRVAWPNAIYPSPDHLMQKMVRLHRPMQLGIDNSVAAAGIWRNLLMGSRAERSLDLERLRDLINTEVKNLRQRKLQGKLSIGGPKPNWEDMN